MNTKHDWTPEDFAIFAHQVAKPISAGKVWPIAAMILADSVDARTMRGYTYSAVIEGHSPAIRELQRQDYQESLQL